MRSCSVSGSSTRTRRVLAAWLAVLLLQSQAAWSSAAAPPPQRRSPAHAPVFSDADFGLHTASFPMLGAGLAYQLRLHLRVLCSGQLLLLKGFAAPLALDASPPPNVSMWRPHWQPPTFKREQLVVRAGNASTPVRWLGPATHGFARFEGRLARRVAARAVLGYPGSSYEWQLPRCDAPALRTGSSGGQALPLRSGQLWNVVTTTSANRLPMARLAPLLLHHIRYHAGLGMQGAILKCGKLEAAQLAGMPDIASAAAASQLVLWPWEADHSAAETMPFLWQKPRNQLALLGAYGRNLSLAYFDLDEYLALPGGGDLQRARCHGRPLLDAARASSWAFTRYSVRQACAQGAAPDLQCWASQPLPTSSGVRLLVEKCPCRFHKLLLAADAAVSVSIHYAFSGVPGRRSAGVPHACAHLLHLHALVAVRGHFMPDNPDHAHIEAAWRLHGDGRGGFMAPARPHGPGGAAAWLLDAAACEVLRSAEARANVGVPDVFSVC